MLTYNNCVIVWDILKEDARVLYEPKQQKKSIPRLLVQCINIVKIHTTQMDGKYYIYGVSFDD